MEKQRAALGSERWVWLWSRARGLAMTPRDRQGAGGSQSSSRYVLLLSSSLWASAGSVLLLKPMHEIVMNGQNSASGTSVSEGSYASMMS